MSQRDRAVPAVYLILKKENEILLMRRQGSGYYDGWYSVPAGHIEAGELPVEALIRETKEEIGVVVQPENLELAHIMYRTKHDETGDRCDMFFVTTTWEGTPKICEAHKCDSIKWSALNNLPKNMMHHVRDAVELIESKRMYSEWGLDQIAQIPEPKQQH